MLFTCKQYAEAAGKSPTSVRHKCERGGYKTAVKIGRDWLIDNNEPDLDGRIKTGNYVGFRRDKKNAEISE